MSIHSLRIQLLRCFQVVIDERPVPANSWRLRSAATLIKLLALAPGYQLHREQLIDALWPDAGHKAAASNLRYALHVARHTLDLAAGSPFLTRSGDQIVLGPPEAVWVDVVAFETAARRAWSESDPIDVEIAIALYQGELLPNDSDEEWIEPRRATLRTSYLSLLSRLATLAEQQGDVPRAIDTLERRLSLDPTDESTHVALMTLHARHGNRALAVAQYVRLVEALRQTLDVEPGFEMRKLAEAIQTGTGPEMHVPPTTEPRASRRAALPTPLTRLIDRENNVRQISKLFDSHRLVTVTGVGGIGKTRLALSVGHTLLDDFSGGAYFVDLAPLQDPEFLAQAISRQLGVTEQVGESLLDMLRRHIGDQRVLLVLDNFEHLLAAAPVVSYLLEDCPQLHVLVTSRERLRLHREQPYLLSPLEVPGHEQSRLEQIRDVPASDLFIERAGETQPDLEIDEESAGVVAEICQRLEGIPLAIELAASLVDRFSLVGLRDSLDRRLPTLTDGPRDLPVRQQTLRDTIAWSYDLLPRDAQQLFRSLSVFASAWSTEAAQAIADRECDVIQGLERLVEQHLAQCTRLPDGSNRYQMLETIREYGLERLEECQEYPETRDRHAAFYLQLAEQAEHRLIGLEQKDWLDRLDQEIDNLRVALAWARERNRIDELLRLLNATARFWRIRSHASEGRRWFEAGLVSDQRPTPELRARALVEAGWLAAEQTDYVHATALLGESLMLFRQLENQQGIASVLLTVGIIAAHQSRFREAETSLQEALAIFRAVGDQPAAADVLNSLGNVMLGLPNYGQSMAYFEECLAIRKSLGDELGEAQVMNGLALAASEQGDHDQAKLLLTRSLDLQLRIGNREGAGYALTNLGWTTLDQDDAPHAVNYFKEGLRIFHDLDIQRIIADVLDGLAEAAWRQGNVRRTARILGYAEVLRDSLSVHRSPEERRRHECTVAKAQALTSDDEWKAAWESGSMMSGREAIAYALSATP